MTRPLVSVIIPYRNMAQSIGACLRSCLRQTYDHLELVLVNNGSGDAGPTIVQQIAECSRHRMLISDCSQEGANFARAHGLTLARGDYIQWLDADDTLANEKIERQVAMMETAKQYDIAYCDWQWRFLLNPQAPMRNYRHLRKSIRYVPPDSCAWQLHLGSVPSASVDFLETHTDDFLLRLLGNRWLPPHAYLLRRPCAERVADQGGLDPTVMVATDRQFFTIAALLGMRFLYVPGTCAFYHWWSPNQITRRSGRPQRAANLERIFSRLRKIAASASGSALNDDHRLLLQQHFDLWRIPGDVTIPVPSANGGYLCDIGSNRVCIDPADAAILAALIQNPGRRWLERHAEIVAHVIPMLWGHHIDIIRTLNRFTEIGLLEQVAVPLADSQFEDNS